ncbi:MAG: OmpA family protein [Planctomycetes bacterium]|nr:OmpA family protein [Planctomycetota bacterium]MCB9909985.1 OmpA family protein [Planctomycetota bacterium]HPF12719.1 OmpA family protein [Planctomycetota bacterium]
MSKVQIKINTIDGGVDGAPGWVATFVDMISLLVTFFILLFTFASIQDYDAFAYPRNLIGTDGIMDKSKGDFMEAPNDDIMSSMDLLRGSSNPHSRPPDKLPESMEAMGQRLTNEHIEFEVQNVQDGIRLRFDERAGFAPGSAKVNPVLAKALREIGGVLENYQHLIVIEGFTDDQFSPTPSYPNPIAMSLARAKAAADVLVRDTYLSPKTIQMAGLGNKPLPNRTGQNALDRAANRRVEVRVLSMSDSRMKQIEGGDE